MAEVRKVYIDNDFYYLNKGSCYKLLTKYDLLDNESPKKTDLVGKLQLLFDTLHTESSPTEALDNMMRWAKDHPS
jgi:hypothetical protein